MEKESFELPPDLLDDELREIIEEKQFKIGDKVLSFDNKEGRVVEVISDNTVSVEYSDGSRFLYNPSQLTKVREALPFESRKDGTAG